MCRQHKLDKRKNLNKGQTKLINSSFSPNRAYQSLIATYVLVLDLVRTIPSTCINLHHVHRYELSILPRSTPSSNIDEKLSSLKLALSWLFSACFLDHKTLHVLPLEPCFLDGGYIATRLMLLLFLTWKIAGTQGPCGRSCRA